MSHLRRTSHLVSLPTYQPTGVFKAPKAFWDWALNDNAATTFSVEQYQTLNDIWIMAQAMYVRVGLRLKDDTDDSVRSRFHRLSLLAQTNWARSAMAEYERNIELGRISRRTSWSDDQ